MRQAMATVRCVVMCCIVGRNNKLAIYNHRAARSNKTVTITLFLRVRSLHNNLPCAFAP